MLKHRTLKNVDIKSRLRKTSWKKIRIMVWERDKYTCQECKKRCEKGDYQAHHRVAWRITKDDSLDNLITVCRSCHIKLDKISNK